MNLPEFIHDLPEDQAQPVAIQTQGDFVAIIQWDGAGEDRHWVLIPKDQVSVVVQALMEHAAQ